jgi:pimeloyl-ACP methyl ester carboxylesterase
MSPEEEEVLKSSISPDSFLHIPSSFSPAQCNENNLIFFIPGNPGLVSYYHTFLSLLSDPKTSANTSKCVVAGFSLGGFEVALDGESVHSENRIRFPENGPNGPFYSLREQIDLTTARLEALVGTLQTQLKAGQDSPAHAPSARWKVILIGHSVGAYISIEVLRLHKQKLSGRASALKGSAIRDQQNFKISAAFLLTPTVVDIALSPSGKLAAPLLTYVSSLPLLASLGARFITKVLPENWLEALVRMVMGSDTPGDAVKYTVSFLGSRYGVRESLSMAADEMKEISEDGWGEEVWGVVEETKKDFEDGGREVNEPTSLVFYFACQDHWVADRTREAIIRTRGGKEEAGRPRMIVAEEKDLVHGWCIRQSGHVAQKVDDWVADINKRNEGS